MKAILKQIIRNNKKLVLALVMISAFSINATAQRFVYIDMEYILDNLPEYKKAQEKLEGVSETWRAEIATKMEDVQNAYKRFQSEQVLMNDKMKSDKIAEIEAKEKAVKEYQRDKFGPNGALFKKRQELIKPIQDKIYKQIEILAKEKSYDFILDKSSGIQMLYANEKYDKSAFILAALKTQ